jgi:signal transduction histidine kinase
MRDIVHDLKTLARGDDEDRGPVDVQSILDVCANMAEHELRPRTKLVKDYRDRVFVLGTSARLGQVFLNLIVNAAQAIPEGHADDNEVRVLVRSLDERRVEVAISDTGEGVSPSNLDRIFEPFFTTKQGAGTGLGLSISHRIITSAGGTITAEQRPERGTVFRVVLPAAESW